MKIFDWFFSSDYQPPVKITPENYPVDFTKKETVVVGVKLQELGVENLNKRVYENFITPKEREALNKAVFSNIEDQLHDFAKDIDLKKIT